jgi:hypothetical protein
MMSYRRLVLLFSLVLSFFVGGNYLVWKCWTEDLLTDRHYNGGDLARLGYLKNSKMPRKNLVDLPYQHVESKDYKEGGIDLVTIGDSFSMGGGGGSNAYYQDFIASYSNLRVMNMPTYSVAGEEEGPDHFTTILRIANSGYLESLGVKYVLLQSVERGCIPNFARQFDFSVTEDISRLRSYFARKENRHKLPDVAFLNDGNFKFIANTLLYHLSDNAFGKKVYRRELSRSFFSVPDDRILLFLGDEMRNIPKVRPADIELMNQNLNKLADLLDKRGIKLIFMPCVDKYDLYSDYLVNNPYPRSIFFEQLRMLPKRYLFIDTKSILAEELRKGEKDIFYADDTHWGWKAAKKIFENVRFE